MTPLSRLKLSSGFVVRLFKSGAPAAISTTLALLLPILGRFYLNDEQYAAWALIATIATIGLLIDFGGPSLAVRIAGAGPISNKRLFVLGGLSGACSLIVGIAAALVWPVYSAHIALEPPVGMQAMLLLTGVGSALRSVLIVLAAIALGRERFVSRASNLLLQVAIQCGVAWTLLAAGVGVAAMPMSILASCIPLLPIYLYDFRAGERKHQCKEPAFAFGASRIDFMSEVKIFMAARGVASFISLAFTQVDRWLIALSADANFVANYDLAARIAVIPKTALLTLGLGFVHEAARLRLRNEVGAVLRKAYIVSLIVVVAGSVGTLAVGYLAFRQFGDQGDPLFMLLLTLLISSNAAHAMTAPGVLIMTGLGKPQFELVYLVPAAITGTAAGGAAVMASSVWGTALAISGSLLLWSILFSLWVPRAVVRGNFKLAAAK